MKDRKNGRTKLPIRGDENVAVGRALLQGTSPLELIGAQQLRIVTLEAALKIATEQLQFCQANHHAVVKGR